MVYSMKKNSSGVRVRLRTLDDVVDAVLCLLGSNPTDSLVGVVLQDGIVNRAGRCDMAAVEQPGGAEWFAGRLLPGVLDLSKGPEQVVLIGYGDRPRARAAVKRAVARSLLPVVGALVVENGSWWRCDDGHGGPDTAVG